MAGLYRLHLSRLAKTDRDSCEQAFGHVGDNDSDEKDDGVEPEVTEYEGDDEEGDAEEDGYGGDDVNKVRDLTSDRRLHGLQAAGQDRDTTHHRPVARVDHHAPTRTLSLIHI